MGNACCSDNPNVKQFDPLMKKHSNINPSTIKINNVNYSEGKIPRKHSVVEKLNQEAGDFRAEQIADLPSGHSLPPRQLNSQGMVYHGEWMNGIPHGKGELYYPDGSYYCGYFKKGIADGEGRFVSPQGWIFQGEVESQQAQGKGTLYHKDLHYKYIGNWSGDLPNGKGKQIWQTKKIQYDGQFLNGKKHGYGLYRTPDFEYQGNFNDNMFNSSGFIQYERGGKYQGNFQNGKKHGKGVYTWPDGSYYEGYYRDDQKHGQGRYKSPDSVFWEGQWVNGKRHGIGTLIIGDKKYVGSWQNDRPTDDSQSQVRSRLRNEDSRLRG